LQPVVFARSVAGGEELSDAKRNRWRGHCIAAAKQSGLNRLPELRDTQKLAEYLADNHPGLQLVGDRTSETPPLKKTLSDSPPPEDVILLVGPEGGITPAENEAIQQAGFQSVRLGTTTLRIETAVAALLAGVRAILG
jgi:16S rRNA (uracil1498-N3)-methyltransferase